jgi:single-stranded DNA-binding protein
MSNDFNKVILIGTVANNPEITEKDGKRTTIVSVLTESEYTKDGKVVPTKEYTRCKAYGYNLDKCTSMKEGYRVRIEGKLHSASWNQGDVKHTMTEVIVDTVVPLG